MPSVEDRLTTLEKEMAELRAMIQQLPDKDWRRTIGAFTGDPVMQEIFEEGKKVREADREKARKKISKKSDGKPQKAK